MQLPGFIQTLFISAESWHMKRVAGGTTRWYLVPDCRRVSRRLPQDGGGGDPGCSDIWLALAAAGHKRSIFISITVYMKLHRNIQIYKVRACARIHTHTHGFMSLLLLKITLFGGGGSQKFIGPGCQLTLLCHCNRILGIEGPPDYIVFFFFEASHRCGGMGWGQKSCP